MATPFEQFKARLKIGTPSMKGVGFDYTPTILQQGQSPEQVGQQIVDKITARKGAGEEIYSIDKQENTSRLATDLINRSAGLKFDEWGKPELNLGNFGESSQGIIKGITERGSLATQAAESRRAFQSAVAQQNLGQYGFTGSMQISGSAIPGAKADNVGAQAASMAMQVAKNKTPYIWGGNSLSQGVDCSGLVQQIYGKLGIKVPRVTYDQAKHGRTVPVSQIQPGDLVFYRPGSRGPEHVGIYIGNGQIVHAANSKLGVITSNLNNSNGKPMLVLRPY
jgi:cell wall-associated NlpC family hydrolase